MGVYTITQAPNQGLLRLYVLVVAMLVVVDTTFLVVALLLYGNAVCTCDAAKAVYPTNATNTINAYTINAGYPTNAPRAATRPPRVHTGAHAQPAGRRKGHAPTPPHHGAGRNHTPSAAVQYER